MNPTLKKILKRTLIPLSAFIIANSSTYTLQQNEQAVVSQFGKPVRVLLNPLEDEPAKVDSINARVTKEIAQYVAENNKSMPDIDDGGAGLKFKLPWPFESVYRIDRRLLEWDGYPEQVPTGDKKYLFVDGTAKWHISNPYIYFVTLGGEENRAHGKLDDVVDGAVRDNISKRDAIESVRSTNRKMMVSDKELEETVRVDSIRDGREKIASEITNQVDDRCSRYGMSVRDFLVKRIVYVDEVKASVEDRMIAERNRIREKYLSEGEGEYQKIMGDKERDLHRIRSEAYKIAEKTRGQGDAEATRIYNEGFSIDPEFYGFYRSMEVMKGIKGAKIVLDNNNQLFRYVAGKK